LKLFERVLEEKIRADMIIANLMTEQDERNALAVLNPITTPENCDTFDDAIAQNMNVT